MNSLAFNGTAQTQEIVSNCSTTAPIPSSQNYQKSKKLERFRQPHMIRNSTKYVSYKDLKEVTTDLKKIYSATNEEEGSSELEKFTKKWDDKYPVISDIWRRNWSGISPLFAFPEEIRKAIYTTNIIEAANRQIRKNIKNKGVFPTDKSIQKIIYLALKNASKKWTMPIKNWPLALNQFEILCGDTQYDLVTKIN